MGAGPLSVASKMFFFFPSSLGESVVPIVYGNGLNNDMHLKVNGL